jgi:hypothetical protein
MTKRRFAKSDSAFLVLAAPASIGIVSARPAHAHVVDGVGFSFRPFWGFPIPYPYPYPDANPDAALPPNDAPLAAYAPPAGWGLGAPSTTWYYCDSPRGYYPYAPQCHTGWHAVPATSVQQ